MLTCTTATHRDPDLKGQPLTSSLLSFACSIEVLLWTAVCKATHLVTIWLASSDLLLTHLALAGLRL